MRVLPFLVTASVVACAVVACGGETMSIGSNPKGDELAGDGCPRFDEPPIVPGYCDGNYAATYDEAGCKVGYHCTEPDDGGAADGSIEGGPIEANGDCEPATSTGLTCTTPNQETPLYAADGCITSYACGQVLTEANDAQAVYVAESGLTLVVRLETDRAKGGQWSASAKTTALLGAGTTFYEPPPTGSAPGTLGHHVFAYRDVPRGDAHPTTLLEFAYALPNATVSKTFSVWLYGTTP